MCGIRIRLDQLVTVNFSDLLSYKMWVLAVIFFIKYPYWGSARLHLYSWDYGERWLVGTYNFFFLLHTQLPFVSLISEMQYIFLFNLTLITPVPEGDQHLYI
jgi:hypothetical protein